MLNGEPVDIEDTNLSEIGSEADKACKQAAAELEVNWEGAGEKPGIEIWRIENKRTKDDLPDFGINRWPKRKYGKFYRGDSYIVLKTTQVEDKLVWDVFFWIGSGSTQDEYGVAAYKANELDDLLGGVPIQHREVEGHESYEFIPGCFSKGVTYMNGGIEGGFRSVEDEKAKEEQAFQQRLFRLRKQGKIVRASEVKFRWKSLYHGDSFVLDAGNKICTWFGEECSPFERNKAACFVSELEVDRCRSKLHQDVSGEEMWELLGEKGDFSSAPEIPHSTSDNEEEVVKFTIRAWSIYDGLLWTKIKEVKGTLTVDKLKDDRAYVIDVGKVVYAWIGANASKSENKKAMKHATNYLTVMKKPMYTGIVRVLQGQEMFCGFNRHVFGAKP